MKETEPLERAADIVEGGRLVQAARIGRAGGNIGARSQPLPVGDEEGLVVGADRHRRRIPADRDEAFDNRHRLAVLPRFLGNAIRDIHHHHAVVVGVGDEERAAIRRDRDAVRRAAFRRLRIQRSRDDLPRSLRQTAAGTRLGFRRLGGARLDDVDCVIPCAGDKQPAIGRHRHIVGPHPHRDVADAPPLLRIHDAHGPATPVAHIQVLAIGSHHARVRVLADPDAAFQRQRLGIEHPDLVSALVANVELSRSRVDRHARQKHLLRIRVRFYRTVELRLAVRIVEDMNLARAAARDEALLAVAAEGQAIPALRQREKLRLLATGHIEHRQAVLVEPAVRRQQPLSVRRDHQLERQIAHRHVLAGGRDTPTVEQQVLIRLQPLPRTQPRAIHVFVRPANRPRARRRTGGTRENQRHPEPECPHQILASHHAPLYANHPSAAKRKTIRL